MICVIKEIWKPIPGWEGSYEASSLGRIRTTGARINQRHGLVLKQRPDKDGYATVRLHRDGKACERFAHRLVAAAFLGPCPLGLTVNHGDGDKAHPASENLEYLTVADNNMHAFRVLGNVPRGPKLDAELAGVIRATKGLKARRELAAEFSVDAQTISDIWNGKTYRRAG